MQLNPIRGATGTIAALASAVALSACGGPSVQQQAVRLLRQQTVSGPNGTPQSPSSVHCTAASNPDCTVVYPDGERDKCSVSINGSNNSVSCSETARPGSSSSGG
jgi:hypothetical protein